jgi:AcrR family transcriptional regulator
LPKIVDTGKIFTATLQVYVERGYESATTKEIAARAGVNEATLYRRYKTKAELFRTALEHELAASPFGHLTAGSDAQTDIASIARAYIETFAEFGAVVMQVINEAAREPELKAVVPALLPNLAKAAQIIAVHQSAGRIAAGNPFQKLIFLIAPLAMVGIASKTDTLSLVSLASLDPEQIAAEFLTGHAA